MKLKQTSCMVNEGFTFSEISVEKTCTFQFNFRRTAIPKNLCSNVQFQWRSRLLWGSDHTHSFLIMLGTPLLATTLQDYQVLIFLGLISTVFEVLQGNQQGFYFGQKMDFWLVSREFPKWVSYSQLGSLDLQIFSISSARDRNRLLWAPCGLVSYKILYIGYT